VKWNEVFSSLNCVQQRNTSLLGASLFRPDDLYARLKAFKSRLPRNSDGKLYVIRHPVPIAAYNARPKLYFVKVDVQACFDTIEQWELLRIIDKLISEVRSLILLRTVLPYREYRTCT
jgi:telomerase reverse transcriptase